MVAVLHSRNVLIGIGTLIVVLIVAVVVLALQPPAELDPTTPEGIAQGYFQAVLDRDVDRTFAHMSDEVTRRCDHLDAQHSFRHGLADDVRVVILDTSLEGDDATVRVEITETYGNHLFMSDTHSFEEALSMERRGAGWAIAEPSWPIHHCPEVRQ
jgi:hypothetical protein